MKIRFVMVTGRVAIDDRRSCLEARAGMSLETEDKPYLVVTGENSYTTMTIGSKTVSLGPHSVLNVKWPRPFRVLPTTHDLKILVGKIWAMIDRNELRSDDAGNSAVGVRG